MMEGTTLSIGKSVLNGALGYAKSAVAEEVALQLGVQRDQAFISAELEMMLSFLMAAHEERDEHRVIKTWVKQVRDVSYDVEDCLLDLAVHLEKRSWWRIPQMLLYQHHAAKQMKQLRAKVEDVSNRSVRYCLIKGFTVEKAADKSSVAYATTNSGFMEARRQQDKAKLDLVQLISRKDEELRVIAVWGTSAVLRVTSIVRMVFDDPKVQNKFECYAWIKMMHPFDPTEFLQGIMRQFYINSLEGVGKTRYNANLGAQVLQKMGKMMVDDLTEEFKGYVKGKSYLIVITDLSSMEEWDQVKICFPNSNEGSRIIVCTEHPEVASLLCIGQESEVPEHKQLSSDRTLFAFYQKGSQDGTDITDSKCSSDVATTSTSGSAPGKRLTCIEKMVPAFKESHVIGRDNEKSDIIKQILNEDGQQLEVISICGMGGVGKTTLIRDVYQSQELSGTFEKRAYVVIMHPFHPEQILGNLVMQLDAKNSEDYVSGNREVLGLIGTGVYQSLATVLEGKKYLVVLDDLASNTEWDAIIPYFPTSETASRIIVTTREENIARHCSRKHENIYNLKTLGDKVACDIFTEKVFGKITNLDSQYPELVEDAKLILKKCNGLPLAIVTIGGFLANQPKTHMDWRRLNEHISAELELNPELGIIRTVLTKSYDGLPYHLKSCFLYLSIFPEDHVISRKRLVRRWTAEGYSSEVRGKSSEEVADSYFMDLIDRSMILPFKESYKSTKAIDSCKVHDLIREISISKSIEENLVFRMEDNCSLNTRAIIRHLVISSDWERDQHEFEITVDLSRVRSLTVFGAWRSFLLSAKMRLLRVLDLENTSGLFDHHLEYIGKFIHLKFLSLRRCIDIYHLPDSIGDLTELQTLDIRGTSILKLPKTITKLWKLLHLDAGGYFGYAQEPGFQQKYEGILEGWTEFRASCCAAGIYGAEVFNMRDAFTRACFVTIPGAMMGLDESGVMLPPGISKLKALQTLKFVHLAWGHAIIEDIKWLTRLRKLGVVGINKKNGPGFCSAISNLRRLESLSLRSNGEPGLQECLDGMFSPPENLQSLKINGILIKLPEWVGKLQNLVKLKLRNTRLLDYHAVTNVLGNLPKLAILKLWWNSFQSSELHFQSTHFRDIIFLELAEKLAEQVKFDNGSMQKLEVLQIKYYNGSNAVGFSGVDLLPSVKEVRLNTLIQPHMFYVHEDDRHRAENVANLEEDLRVQLARNPNKPILNVG